MSSYNSRRFLSVLSSGEAVEIANCGKLRLTSEEALVSLARAEAALDDLTAARGPSIPRGRPRDGFLPAYDVYTLHLNADLIVLSACQTALGDSDGATLVGAVLLGGFHSPGRVAVNLDRERS